MAKKRTSRQESKKRLDGQCYFCEEKEYSLLDAHRIFEGKDGGTYHPWNMLTLCANCHRKVHSGIIKILGKHHCMGGSRLTVIRYIEDGQEKWR